MALSHYAWRRETGQHGGAFAAARPRRLPPWLWPSPSRSSTYCRRFSESAWHPNCLIS